MSFGYQVLGFVSGGEKGLFPVATGGNSCGTSGDYKWHKFTGPGTLCVSCAGNCAGSTRLDYMVVAGGGSGPSGVAGIPGGGGGGGYRESVPSPAAWTASPLADACSTVITAAVSAYPITVGAGGPKGSPPSGGWAPGVPSVFSTITSTGGGRGGKGDPSPVNPTGYNGQPGGSGGGSANCITFGNGNTPPTTPPQGKNGGLYRSPGPSDPSGGSGGGGGALNVGGNAVPGPQNTPSHSGNGGDGTTSCISATPTAYAGGGGGGSGHYWEVPQPVAGIGGTGGGGPGQGPAPCYMPGAPPCGTVNTGGGGGGASAYTNLDGGDGGSGIVIIRYKYQ